MIAHRTWRLLHTNTGTAQWNLALDEALLASYGEGDLPIIRLYGWENALSIGRFSNPSKSLHLKNVQAHTIQCVRRISGGGILVHGGDLSYTLIIPRNWLKDAGVKESYRYLCQFLINLYKKMGHTARFAADLDLSETKSDVCLAGIESYDLVIEGKKIGGNAQRYTNAAVFQHGSIPMRIDDTYFKPFFLGECGLDTTASLQRLGTVISYEKLCRLLQEAFCETFACTLVPDTLSAREEEKVSDLYANKYTQAHWNDHA